MKKMCLFAALAVIAGVLSTGCGEETSDSGKPVKLSAPQVGITDVEADSFRASWESVENCTAYAYSLVSLVDGAETAIRQDDAFVDTRILFEGLQPRTNYVLRVKALAAEGSGYADSEAGCASAETPARTEPVSPWVDVELSCILLEGKLTLHMSNKPNATCAHIYSSTENVNVIGDGYDDEQTLIGYIIEDYENNVPGVYRDSKEHNFNNYGAGFVPGTKLFYYVVGEDESGRAGRLNWYWVEVPANAGDDVIVLDSAEI